MPLQKSFKPPPEPVLSTIGVLKLVDFPKVSATAEENGNTVEEPTILIWSLAFALDASESIKPASRMVFFCIKQSSISKIGAPTERKYLLLRKEV